MADLVAPISSAIRPIEPIAPPRVGGTSGNFADTLKNAIAEVDRTQKAAESAAQDFAAGRTTDVAGTMIAVERATVTFQLMLQIRNRLLEAYQEIQRIQV
jgi:flagellar hook-basal body complex protein FliE